ncbi:TolC family protein [Marinoscillum luteum]|uniref:TolC family protein n=1 Tax=Marinoscillum luteum TaxID=861051 RepID=A0ABW7N6U9_9BACT
MKHLIKYMSLVGILLVSSHLQAQDSDILSTYLTEAAENNPDVKASFQRYYAALERVPQVGALPDPKAMIGYFILPVETRVGPRRFDVQLSQAFPWFGTLAAKEDQASKEAEAQYQVFLKTKNDLFYQVKEAYYQLYIIDKSISITRGYLDILARDERVSLNRVEAGKATTADVLRIQMEIKERTAELESFVDKRQSVAARLNALLNREVNEELSVSQEIMADSVQSQYTALIDSVLLHNPEINRFRKQQEALDSKIKVAQKSGRPSFSLGLSYANVTPRTDTEMNIPGDGQDMLMPMATVSIPLFRKKYRAMVDEATFQKNSLQQDILNVENQLQSNLVAAINQYRDAQRNLNLYGELTQQANQTLNILTEAYVGGEEDYEEVLRIEQQLLRYQLGLEKAKAEVNIAVALIDKLLAKNIQ